MEDNREIRPFFTDKTGRNVKVGDYIAYGHNLGRCAGIRFGKVCQIAAVEATRWSGQTEIEWRITVIGVDDDWCGREIKLCTRKGVLLFPERIICINELIPEEYKELLKTVS